MAHNPQYHSWLFRPSAKPRPMTVDDLDAQPNTAPPNPNIRKRLEILEEARLLKRNLTDLW